MGARVLTGVVLLPLVVALDLALGTAGFSVAVGLVTLLAAWEWARLSGWGQPLAQAAYTAGVAAVLVTVAALTGHDAGVFVLLGAGLAWWAVALVLLRRYRSGLGSGLSPPLKGLAGLLVLVPAWVALAALHGHGTQGPHWVLMLLGVVWAADVGAYFAGRRFGRRKLAPRVSPGKTWEGVVGGLAAAAAVGAAALALLPVPPARVAPFLLLVVATSALSVVGDLLESLFKREAGIKDSGRILPGHGGVLDRIDSVTAAAPLFALGVLLLGDPR